MHLISNGLGTILGYIMYLGYIISNSYGFSILFFAIATKIITFPLSILAQKNSIRLLRIQPKIQEINQRYNGEKNRINELQYELFKQEKYNPLIGLFPLLIQLILIIGIVNVVYNPLTHLLHLDNESILIFENFTKEYLSVAELGSAAQLYIIDNIRNMGNIDVNQQAIQDIFNLNMNFYDIDLLEIPSFTSFSILWLFPMFSGIFSFVLCIIQNSLSPAQQQQSFFGKWGMTIFLVTFSIYFPFVMPASIGLYWVISNLLGIIVALLLNLLYNPKKLVPIEIISSSNQKLNLSKEKFIIEKQHKVKLKAQEKKDLKRFFTSDKQLVFYSISSGQYKYFKNIIEYILKHSELVVHYITNDPDDKVFLINNPKFIVYYIGAKKIVMTMLRMDSNIVITTVPDLQKYHIKRSIVRNDIEYIYIFHTVASMHMTLRENALDYYDTIFCVGPHQVNEIRKTEQVYNLPAKKLVKCGYNVIDQLTEAYQNMGSHQNEKPQILIAPSWQEDNILDSCLVHLIEKLDSKMYNIIIRPHPEYIKRFPQKMQYILDRYSNRTEKLLFDLDFSNNENIFQSDILITDWSNIAFEFSYCTKKPSIFINTKMKVMNPEYERLGITPLDITLRDEIGVSIDVESLNEVNDVVDQMLHNKSSYHDRIDKVIHEYLYHPGRSGEAGGKYIINRLAK